jgi:hypothetical protein
MSPGATFTAKNIDDLVSRVHKKRRRKGELQQLAALFSPGFWKPFEALIRSDSSFSSSNGMESKVEVSLGYIDKIPMAGFNNVVKDHWGQDITERVEIGDAAVFFINRLQIHSGTCFLRAARGLILQAKVVGNAKGKALVTPVVSLPSKKNDSTLKELALLSAWPAFDLYFAAGSNTALQYGYQIGAGSFVQSKQAPPHAWYIGASSDPKRPFSPHWVASAARQCEPCDQSLGTLLEALVRTGSLDCGKKVGADFTFDASRIAGREDFKLADTASPPDWSDLCHQLMLACNKYAMPSHLLKKGENSGRFNTAHACATPYHLVWNWLVSRFSRKKRFPVVVILVNSREGS